MELRWSLEDLYFSFEEKAFQEDIKKCENMIEKINRWTESNLNSDENAIKKIEDNIALQTEFYLVFTKLTSYASLILSVEAKNEKAQQVMDSLQKKYADLTKAFVSFQLWLGALENLEDMIDSSKGLQEYRFYLMETASKNKYLLGEREEIVIAKMQNTGSDSWSKLQEIITSTLLVEVTVQGKKEKLPLPVVRNMAYDKDPKIRKEAYEAELKAYDEIAESSAACLNGIKGEVITLSDLRGYGSPLEKTLLESRMKKETLEAMLTAMRESLPIFRKYYKRKGEILGHKEGLPFFDLFAPIGQVNKTFSYEEARTFIVDNFKTFSTKLADFADYGFKNRWIDAEPREGKRGGAFCSNLMSIKQSRVLTNFTGSFSNVTTLAHELGHAYHGDCLKNEAFLNTDYPMPIAETASIFCETIVKNAAIKATAKEEAVGLLEASISDAAQVIVDIYSRYLFETELFKKRDQYSLSVNELKEIMINSQKEAYGDGLHKDFLHPYMWVCKPHYYYAEANFYNFPYAFGLLFSKGLYSEYLKKGEEFVEQYDILLASTGKNTIENITASIGIDISSVDFWRSSLKIIEEDIEQFIELSKELKK